MQVRLIDRNDPAEYPDLDVVLVDAVNAIAALRAEVGPTPYNRNQRPNHPGNGPRRPPTLMRRPGMGILWTRSTTTLRSAMRWRC